MKRIDNKKMDIQRFDRKPMKWEQEKKMILYKDRIKFNNYLNSVLQVKGIKFDKRNSNYYYLNSKHK